MKDNFIYILSAFLVIAVILIQISTQAVTNAKDDRTMPQFEKDIKHLEKGMNSDGQNLNNKVREDAKSNNK